MKKVMIIFCILISMGVVSPVVSSTKIPNYLGVSTSDVSPPDSARIGQPVAATMTLKRVGTVPDEATLKIVTELDRPDIEVTIDNETQDYGLKEFDIALSSEGVSEINIRIDGYAPKVEKLKDIKVIDVVTNVLYKGEDAQDQLDGTIKLTVSDKEIRRTVLTIEEAQDKLAVAEAKVASLKKSGVNTVELEAEIQNAKDLLENAEDLHEREEIDIAKSTAEAASKILDGVILKAEKMDIGPAPADIKRYLVIAGAVLLVLILAFILKGRREELG